MSRVLALVLATLASLAWAQAPAPEKSQTAQKAQKAQKAKAPQKPHAKPTPEQIRQFNELQKQGGKP